MMYYVENGDKNNAMHCLRRAKALVQIVSIENFELEVKKLKCIEDECKKMNNLKKET